MKSRLTTGLLYVLPVVGLALLLWAHWRWELGCEHVQLDPDGKDRVVQVPPGTSVYVVTNTARDGVLSVVMSSRVLEYTVSSAAQAEGMSLAATMWLGATYVAVDKLTDGRYRVLASFNTPPVAPDALEAGKPQ